MPEKLFIEPKTAKKLVEFLTLFEKETSLIWQETNDNESVLYTKAKIVSDNKAGKDVALILDETSLS